MTMNFVVSCVVLMFAGFLLVVMGNDYCPNDPEYFSESSGLRYYCGDICVKSDNQLCLKAKSVQCCPKNKYYNVTQLKLDLDDKSKRLNETEEKLDYTTNQRNKYEEEIKDLKKERKGLLILTIVFGICTLGLLPYAGYRLYKYIRYVQDKRIPEAQSETGQRTIKHKPGGNGRGHPDAGGGPGQAPGAPEAPGEGVELIPPSAHVEFSESHIGAPTSNA